MLFVFSTDDIIPIFPAYNGNRILVRREKMKKIVSVLVSCLLIGQCVYAAPKSEMEIQAKSGVVMEASTGKIIYEKNADEKLPPASVTKVMTMLLIFDAIDSGKIKSEDMVTVSEFAASMGGSQVFLEPGETQNVETMLKCIAVASANDACVAMAEHICGDEKTFVSQMNERAKKLGMKNTHFVNCNGLDAKGHLTTARDIAIMSKELITRYPEVHKYTKIWQENITHKTKKGISEFGLTNTNKFIRQYPYATGLKTGSTGKAKFCLSATAEKDNIKLVSVVMASPDAKQRVKDSVALMNYGFGRCKKYEDKVPIKKKKVQVERGQKEMIKVQTKKRFEYIDISGAELSSIKKKVEMKKKISAPIKKGQELGRVIYYLNKKEIGNLPIVAKESVKEVDYPYAIHSVLATFFL